MKAIHQEAETKMKLAVEHMHAELKRLRTGRATLGLLDGVTVDYFGTPTPLKQVATLTVVDATMLMAQPWDAKQIPAIERALQKSDLGLNPMSDGKTVRIPIPQPTEERRKELVKKAHEIAEHARTGIRAARREANDKLKKLEKEHELGQDDERRALEEIQKLHDREIDEVAKVLEHKEKDIMTV
ncbi:MAG: ribosome recycling factor [Thermoanaerobaculia bacterium]|nr:ribosome recycling factor [Thermoanaerobaculia bacterium]MBP9826288.1 ribosome recycling factor [Thermoanaerobaculia bacterium]